MFNIYNKAISGPWITEPSTDTQYKVVEDKTSITISFQGSVSRLDWVSNFNCLLKPYKSMSNLFFVHAGFIKKYKSIRKVVRTKALKAKSQNKQFFLTGYSQGAIIAMVAHEDIRSQLGLAVRTIVFGCPRGFSRYGQKILKLRFENVTRVENGNDAVTKIPFRWLLYKHYGKVVHIGGERKWWKFSFKDHLTYRRNLDEALD